MTTTEIPPQPAAVRRLQQEQEAQRELEVNMFFGICRHAARGGLLFGEIPEVKGVILANTMLDNFARHMLSAHKQIVVP